MLHARDELHAVILDVPDGAWERLVPYGSHSLHDVLAHIAGADQVWAVSAQGLLRGETDDTRPLTPGAAAAARERAIVRGRRQSIAELREEMARRRALLLGLYDLLELKHLALSLPAFGDAHNGVRERIWVGYHDRLHAADIRRALNMSWHPPKLTFEPEIEMAAEAIVPREVLRVIYSIDPAWWERPSNVPGWTYRQLLAHIASGDRVVQHLMRSAIEDGGFGAFPDVAAGNAERLAERAQANVRSLVDELLSMRHQTRLLMSKLEPQHLALAIVAPRDPPVTFTLAEWMNAYPQHDRVHGDNLRPAMKYRTSRFA